MKKLIWTSDIHLDRMDEREYTEMREWIAETDAEALVLAGDIARADSLTDFLTDLEAVFRRKIYFVLGNHDFHNGSYRKVRDEMRELVEKNENLVWLSETEAVPLGGSVAAIGHEGWGDARYGSFNLNGMVPKDFMLIEDLIKLKRAEYVEKLNKLGDIAAEHIGRVLRGAVRKFEKIILVTHVPPFREASLGKDLRICDDHKLTFYSCKAVGDVIREIMLENPDRHLHVLCGHTHQKCRVEILKNLTVEVRDSGYGVFYPPGSVRI